ncbi:MAG: L,D-transpeptidase family protein [Panacagrimonas sp.]
MRKQAHFTGSNRGPALFALTLGLTAAIANAQSSPPIPVTSEQVLTATQETVGPGYKGAAAVRAQILLDRARFSPGEIDGAYGSTLRGAVSGFQKARSLPVTGIVDPPTWDALNAEGAPSLAKYSISDADVAGPFLPLPDDMMEKAKLPALQFGSVAEAFGERFHVNPELLQQLNVGKDLARVGEDILVPNVSPPTAVAGAESLTVDKSASTVSLHDASGKVLAQFPATTGSKHDPLPVGRWKVNGVGRNPEFKYNPNLFWDADSAHSKATIPPGPNNPVGVVWVDLSKPHYGIHGTPEPSKIGKTQSHGCIRLTNWDASTLAESVSPGMRAILQR